MPHISTTVGPLTLTHVIAAAGQEYPACPYNQLNDLHVQVRHAAFPEQVWNVMLPENFLGAGRDDYTGFRPVLGMTWKAHGPALAFDWIDYHGNVELRVRSEVAIVADDAIRYRVEISNPGTEPLRDVNFNACFNHRFAAPFGRKGFVPTATGWRDTGAIEDIPPPGVPYFLVATREAAWRAARQEREHYVPHPRVKLAAGAIATTACGYTLGHVVPAAVLVWHNPRNPCTDIWHWFGDVPPGARRLSEGWLYFLPGGEDPAAIEVRAAADAGP